MTSARAGTANARRLKATTTNSARIRPPPPARSPHNACFTFWIYRVDVGFASKCSSGTTEISRLFPKEVLEALEVLAESLVVRRELQGPPVGGARLGEVTQ